MTSVFPILIAAAAVLLLGTLGDVLFRRARMPASLWLVLCAVLLGPVFGLVPRGYALHAAPFLLPFVLIAVLSDLEKHLSLPRASHDLKRNGLLAGIAFFASTALVSATSVLVHAAGLVPETVSWTDALLLGVVVAAPCSSVAVSLVSRSRVSHRVIRCLEQESCFGSVLALLIVALLIPVLDPHVQGFLGTLLHLLRALSLGLCVGLAAIAVWTGLLLLLRSSFNARVITHAIMLLAYAVSVEVNASVILAMLVFALAVANANLIIERFRLPIRLDAESDPFAFRVWSGFLVKTAFFLFVGLMIWPQWDLFVLGLLLTLALIAGRLPSVLAVFRLMPADRAEISSNNKVTVGIAIPRGMLAGALSLLLVQTSVVDAAIFLIPAFTVVAASVAVFVFALVLDGFVRSAKLHE